MERVASTLYTTSEHGLSNITTADAHTSAASSRLNWRPRQFKLTRPFRQKTKSGFCACAITFQTQSTNVSGNGAAVIFRVVHEAGNSKCLWKFCNYYQLTWCHIPRDSNFFRTILVDWTWLRRYSVNLSFRTWRCCWRNSCSRLWTYPLYFLISHQLNTWLVNSQCFL